MTTHFHILNNNKEYKKVLFISSLNLSLNPRIVKEIKLARSLNFKIEFIGFNISSWANDLDLEIKEQLPEVTIKYISATRKPFFPWFFSAIIEYSCKLIYPLFKNSLKVNAYASTKRTYLLDKFLKSKPNGHYDFIIAHTITTLYAVKQYAQKIGKPFAFDVEDYHPGEKIQMDIINEKQRRERLLREILPLASYVSTASPLINESIKKLTTVDPLTILNYFPKNEFLPPINSSGNKLKLIWFSQNINARRGLELVLSSWDKLKFNFQLTLIGKLDNDFHEKYISKHHDIIIKGPLLQEDLHKELFLYDIGLAIDVDKDDYNRSIAITNKMLAYFQAGLYIVATDTPAQQEFIKINPDHGVMVKQDSISMFNALSNIFECKKEIRKNSELRFVHASLFSWETESEKLEYVWRKLNIAV